MGHLQLNVIVSYLANYASYARHNDNIHLKMARMVRNM
jgi:hypothetical protein